MLQEIPSKSIFVVTKKLSHLKKFLQLTNLCSLYRRNATENPSKLSQEVRVQLDVFNEQKDGDEAAARSNGPLSSGVDLNSHLDIFYAILRQVKI